MLYMHELSLDSPEHFGEIVRMNRCQLLFSGCGQLDILATTLAWKTRQSRNWKSGQGVEAKWQKSASSLSRIFRGLCFWCVVMTGIDGIFYTSLVVFLRDSVYCFVRSCLLSTNWDERSSITGQFFRISV